MEVLVVTALTVIVMGLVFGPVMESFGLTRRAEIMVRAQDNSRLALSQVTRDLKDAMFVYDNSQSPVDFPVRDQFGVPVTVQAYYSKVDLVLPRMKAYCTAPTGTGTGEHDPNEPREYERGNEAAPICTVDSSKLELRPIQPLAPDTKIVRYFVALQDPTQPYYNRYTSSGGSATKPNMFVLYRAEFSPFDPTLFEDVSAANAQNNLNDPNFFYNLNPSAAGGASVAAGWKKISRIIINPNGADLVNIDTSFATPVVTPTVRFAPTAVYNDPLVPATDKNTDAENGDAPPTTYKATYGQWTSPYEVTVVQAGGNTYKTAHNPASTTSIDMNIYLNGDTSTDPVFEITNYERTKAASIYGAGNISPANPEMAFTVDTRKGTVNFAFPHVDVDLSKNLSSLMGGNMAASISMPTNDLNVLYDAAPFSDRFRVCEFNLPKDHEINWYSCPPYTFTKAEYGPILGNSTVVPGMERVIGPCATEGSSYGRPMLYSRVPFWNMLADPTLNQYKLDIDYPVRNDIGNIIPGMEGSAALYFHSGMTQAGEGIRLPDSDEYDYAKSGRNITNGLEDVYVLYYEQNNRKGDRLRATYVTKSLMTVIMGIKLYEPNSGKAHSTQLTNKVRLKNISS